MTIFRRVSAKFSSLLGMLVLAGFASAAAQNVPKPDIRLITLDPGHFHAALFQKEFIPGVSEQVHVYAPMGSDLIAHLNRISQFNSRPENPTNWKLEVHASPDFMNRLLTEKQGNVVVISGKNREKIERINQLVKAGFNVLADKPWIIEPESLGELQRALDMAEKKRVIAFDAMTERFEITSILQKELVNSPEIFGQPEKGSVENPAVYMESLHFLLKEVAGVPNLRPAWFFDVREQGEGLPDVGTHLVERVQSTLCPQQAIDFRKDIRILDGNRWPTTIAKSQFQRVTGTKEFPSYLKEWIKDDQLQYFCNTDVTYALRGVHAKLVIRWGFEATATEKDSACFVFRGTRSRIEVQQSPGNDQPEVFVIPNRSEEREAVQAALTQKIQSLQPKYPGVSLVLPGPESVQFRLNIPAVYRVGHEAHFAAVCRRFLEHVRDPKTLPVWEKPNMLAKYYVTTKAIELARSKTK